MEIVDLTDSEEDLSPDELDRIPLIGFHTKGSLPPLFAVRTWAEEVENYRRLADQLGPDQPIYTVSPPMGRQPSDFPADTNAWAALCLERFGALLEREQVVLMGWSYAGVVALRVAQALAERGADVRLVALVDSTLPRKKPWGSSLKRSELHHFVVAMERMFEIDEPRERRRFFWRYVRKTPKRWLQKARQALLGAPARAGARAGEEAGAAGEDASERSSIASRESREQRAPLLMRAIRIAYLKHKAEPTALPVALFWTEESRARTGDTSLGWSSVLHGDIEIVRIAGAHQTLFAAEHIAPFARRLAHSLRRVWADDWGQARIAPKRQFVPDPNLRAAG
ncbi:MAG TPA: thioesterase domain-containing protein [Myxococcota bacterium]|nr:thioesterase domain-containing protein [Myxococcota bacterium]